MKLLMIERSTLNPWGFCRSINCKLRNQNKLRQQMDKKHVSLHIFYDMECCYFHIPG